MNGRLRNSRGFSRRERERERFKIASGTVEVCGG